MTTDLLLEAESLVDDFCRQLVLLRDRARHLQQGLEQELRQLNRFLDEMGVRLRLAESGTAPIATDPQQMRIKRKEIREQKEDILARLNEAEEREQRLELLLRQVEMSGRSLRKETHLKPYDPWEMALHSQILYGREQERSSLAREVHDGPAQVLSNLTLGLERCRQNLQQEVEQDAELVESLLRDTRRGLQEVRRFIYDLRPSPLADEPLGQQVERFIRDLQTAYQIAVAFDWAPPPRQLSNEEKVSIYRIIQEALQNARRHARAQQIQLQASLESASWTVQITDDGVGFDPNHLWREEDHWGIIGMRERARLIGASLTIDSAPDQGTTILLRLPAGSEGPSKEGAP